MDLPPGQNLPRPSGALHSQSPSNETGPPGWKVEDVAEMFLKKRSELSLVPWRTVIFQLTCWKQMIRLLSVPNLWSSPSRPSLPWFLHHQKHSCGLCVTCSGNPVVAKGTTWDEKIKAKRNSWCSWYKDVLFSLEQSWGVRTRWMVTVFFTRVRGERVRLVGVDLQWEGNELKATWGVTFSLVGIWNRRRKGQYNCNV